MDNGGRVIWTIDADTASFNRQVDAASQKIGGLTSELSNADRAGSASLSALSSAAQSVGNALGTAGRAIASVGFSALELAATGAGAAIAAMGAKGLASAGQLQSLQIQMNGLTKSAAIGAQTMGEAYAYALTSPFQLPDVAATTKELIAFGETSKEAISNLSLLGNVSITSGLPLQQLGGIFGQVSAQGVLMLGDIRQLTQDGVGILPALENEFGKTALQVQDMATAGQISFDQFKTAMASIVDPTVLDQLTNTLPRQLDRLHGSLRVISDAFVGVTVDTVNGLTVAQNGLSQASINLVRTLANTLRAPDVVNAVTQMGNAMVPLVNEITKILPPLITGFANLAAKISEVKAIAIPFIGLMLAGVGGLADKIPILGEYVGFLKGPIGVILGLIGGLIAASPALRAGLVEAFQILSNVFTSMKPAVDALGQAFAGQAQQLGAALAPVVVELARALADVLRAILPLVPILTGALVNALAAILPLLIPILQIIDQLALAFAALPRPIQGFLVYAGLFAYAFFQIRGALATTAVAAAEAAPTVAASMVEMATGVVSAAGILAGGIEAIAIAAGAIALLGLGIGLAIAEVGAGFIVFGKGVEAIGNGAKTLASGITTIERIDLRGLAETMAGIASAFAGLAPRVLDFATAALTFPRMGEGLILLAQGMTQLQYVSTDAISQKLPALGEALKSFQISFIQNLFSGNILSKFADMGDALSNIARIINMISNLTIDPQQLRTSLQNLATGLKAFLIPEIQPSWINSIFGANTVEPKSVTDYMGTLGSIIKPITDLQTIFNAKNFDPKKLETDLRDLSIGLKAFMTNGETRPSWINSIFGGDIVSRVSVTSYMGSLGGIIKPLQDLQAIFDAKTFDPRKLETDLRDLAIGLKAFLTTGEVKASWINSVFGDNVVQTTSVTSYMKSLGDIVKPIGDLQNIFNAKNFNGTTLEKNLKDLATGLKAFTTTEVTPSWIERTFGGPTINTVGLLGKLGSFADLATGLSELQKLFTTKDFDAAKFDVFLRNLGNALKAFTVTDISQTVSFLGKSSYSQDTRGILQYFNTFGTLAQGLTALNGLLTTQNFDAGKFTTFVHNLGTALQSFVVTDISATVSQFMGRSSSLTTSTTGILQYFNNFGTLADGVIKFQGLISGKDFNAGIMLTFLRNLGNTLQAFMVTGIDETVKTFVGSRTDKSTYTSVLEHLGNFQVFASGIEGIINTIFSKDIKFDPTVFARVLTTIGKTLENFSAFDSSSSASMLGISASDSRKYTNVLEHLGNFNDFASGVKTMADVIGNKDFVVDKFDSALTAIGNTLKKFEEKDTTYANSSIGKGNKGSVTYDNIMSHMSNFKTFADGIQTIATVIGSKDFHVDTFTKALDGIFSAVEQLMIKETTATKSGVFSSSTTSTNYTSIISKLGDIQGLARAIQGFQAAGIGTKGFDGVMFQGALYYISQGLKSLLTISQSNFAAIDVGKLNALTNAITNIKNVTTSWNTATLATQSAQISAFMKTFASGLVTDISDKSAEMLNAGKNLGTQLTNGLRSGVAGAAAAGAALQSGIWQGIQSHFADEYAQGVALAQQVINGIRAGGAGANGAGNFIQSQMWAGIQGHMPDEYFQGQALANQVVNGIRAGGGGAAEGGHALQSAMWAGIQGRMGDEYSQGVALANQVTNGLRAGQSGAWSAGDNVAAGFAGGISRNVWQINAAVGNLSSAAIGRLRELLGIHSPSTVMAEIGDFMTQGLAQGIERGQARLVDSATSVATAVSGVFSTIKPTITPTVDMAALSAGANRLTTPTTVAAGSFAYNGSQGTTTVENHIGTISIANEVDAKTWLQKLTRQDEVTSTGLTPNA